MSGHNKWAQIKHKKAITDAKKGAAFSKLVRAITLAARGNPDPATNIRLRGEVERARAVNMPNENIERAIKKVADKDSAALAELQVELIGPGGVAIIVHAITDSSNRTINELKQLVSKAGGRMVPPGSLQWMFQKTEHGLVPTAPVPVSDPDALNTLIGLLDEHDDVQNVFTNAAR